MSRKIKNQKNYIKSLFSVFYLKVKKQHLPQRYVLNTGNLPEFHLQPFQIYKRGIKNDTRYIKTKPID